MSTVTCAHCRADVPVATTTFTERGDYLCARCTNVADLSQTLERSRQASLAEARANRGHGLFGLLWSALTQGSRVRQAEREHAAFAATLPNVGQPAAACSGCGVAAAVWNNLCERCSASPK